jgi:hypothetical protein
VTGRASLPRMAEGVPAEGIPKGLKRYALHL